MKPVRMFFFSIIIINRNDFFRRIYARSYYCIAKSKEKEKKRVRIERLRWTEGARSLDRVRATDERMKGYTEIQKCYIINRSLL